VCEWQVKLYDPLYTRAISERFRDAHDKALYKFTLLYFYCFLYCAGALTVYLERRCSALLLQEERCEDRSLRTCSCHCLRAECLSNINTCDVAHLYNCLAVFVEQLSNVTIRLTTTQNVVRQSNVEISYSTYLLH